MGRRSLLLAGGEISQPASLRARIADWNPEQIIAADGGSRHAASLGVKLDAVVGDLDSLDPQAIEDLLGSGVRIERRQPAKDETDLELALRLAVDLGAEEVAVVGAFGGRVDMTIANVMLLLHRDLGSTRVELWHDDQTAWVIRSPGGEIRGAPGDTISLIPLGPSAQGVTTRNLVYGLQDETLAVGPARGVSNVIAESPARIELSSGFLLAVHTPGRA